jgi:uncharacterized damage-inducible protein DinB
MKTTTATAKTEAQEFVEASRMFITQEFLPMLAHCLERMSEEDIWWRPNDRSNSVGNLVLHLCGNVRFWLIKSVGRGDYQRNREAEFAARGPIPTAELIASLRSAVNEADKILEELPVSRLLERYSIVRYNTSGLQAVYHVIEHFSRHLGQILYVYKMRTGRDLDFHLD